MNKAMKWIIIAAAVFLMVPHSFAAVTGFGGESAGQSVSSISTMSLGQDSSFMSNQVLSHMSGSSSLSSGVYFTSGGPGIPTGWVNQSHQADSGNYHAAAYAYMDPSKATSITYQCTPTTTATSAAITQDVTASDARNLTFGGYAYNLNDYAAVQISGEADTINYHNAMSSTKTLVSASQTFSGTGCNLSAYAWAERGNIANENLTPLNILNTSTGYLGFIPGPRTDNATYLFATRQTAAFYNGTIASYSSQAQLASNTAASTAATSSQTASVSSANFTYFSGEAAKGTLNKYVINQWTRDSYLAESNAQVTNGTGITYSGSASSALTNQSSSQNLKAASSQFISAYSGAGRFLDTFNPTSNAQSMNDYYARQNAFLINATTGNNGYKSGSYISGGTNAVAWQSANIPSANFSIFNGYAEAGIGTLARNISNGEWIGAEEDTFVKNGTTMSYNARSQATGAGSVSKETVSVTQTLKAKSSEHMNSYADAYYENDNNYDIVNDTGTIIDYGAGQGAFEIDNATWGKNGYTNSASISGAGKTSGTASSSQAADISSAKYSEFDGGSGGEVYNNASGLINSEYIDSDAGADAENGKAINYQANSQFAMASSGKISASTLSANSAHAADQTLKATSADAADAWAHVYYENDANWDMNDKTGTMSTYELDQRVGLSNVKLGANGIGSSITLAKVTSNQGITPTASLTAEILSADSASFEGGVQADNDVAGVNTDDYTRLYGDSSTYVDMGKNLKYTASSTAANPLQISTGSVSATQTASNLNSKSFTSNTTEREAMAGWDSYHNDTTAGTITEDIYEADSGALATQLPGSAFTAYMTGTDTAKASGGAKGQASADQQLTAGANFISRYINAGQFNSDALNDVFYVEGATTISTDQPQNNLLNTLTGESKATVNFNSGASIATIKTWTAKVQKELGSPNAFDFTYNFGRSTYADNLEGDHSGFDLEKYSKKGALTVTFTESASATDSDASAA